MTIAMLMSSTYAGRSSEICKLDTKFMNVEQDKIVFTMTELTKNRKVSDKRLQMTFHTHRESKQCQRLYIEIS